MKRRSVIALPAVLALSVTATFASAACDFEHPKKAKKFQSNLVQAFLSCGAANDTTEGGVPSCSPPETFNQLDGSPPSGWLWDESSGQGQVSFKASKNKVVSPLNPPGSQDIAVKLKLKGVEALDSPAGASGPGTLATVARATLNDRNADMVESGDDQSMTVIDFPASFPFTLTGGKATLKTSANVILNGLGLPGLPGCSNVEPTSVRVLDENGSAFATLGTFLTDEIQP